MTSPLTVHFLPDDRVFSGAGPVDLFLAASACDILLDQPCGSAGTCGKCRVQFLNNPPDPTPPDLSLLTRSEVEEGWRLGCQAVVRQPTRVVIQPAARTVPPKSFGERVIQTAGRIPIDERPDRWGLAIDVGSTTLAVGLIRCVDGLLEASVSQLNPQVGVGADVMSRIHAAETQPGMAERLKMVVQSELASMTRQLLDRTGVGKSQVHHAACVGNPTMLHLLLGADVSPLARAPFLTPWMAERICTATDLGLPIRDDAQVYMFPPILSHVGADAVAAAVSAGIDLADRPRIVVDLGTNSEVVAGCAGGMVAASTAAGPAFEGATIACGMRAAPGAIDALSLSEAGEIAFDTIEHAPALGLCGSGLIDAVAELTRAGAIDESGYLRSPHEVQSSPMARHITIEDGRRALLLADDSERGGKRVFLAATDIRELQLAKGSIRAGISILCRELSVPEAELDGVFIAGLFGSHLRKASLLRIGLVPRIDPERVHFVGNAAGMGARLALVDRRIRDRARALASRTRYIDLARHPGYVETFCAALSLSS